MSRQTIGIDTAQRVLFLHGEDAQGKVVLREKLARERLLPICRHCMHGAGWGETGARRRASVLRFCARRPTPEMAGRLPLPLLFVGALVSGVVACREELDDLAIDLPIPARQILPCRNRESASVFCAGDAASPSR
jgi:hypothetical protein